MTSNFAGLFPLSRKAYEVLFFCFKAFPLFTILQWTPIGRLQYMGKTSTESWLNLPGRYAWCLTEAVGPINLLYNLYALPARISNPSASSSSILGTGLPVTHELLGMLYLVHYANRAFITPLVYAPSMSPMHAIVAISMSLFQFTNATCIASWLVYSAADGQDIYSSSIPISVLGLAIFFFGLYGNISAEHTFFSLRRGAAKRRARSEGRATITYDKVYVVPPPEGWFKYILYPHYALEYFEWTGYWILGGGLGLGWNTPALWFLINEVCATVPRAVSGKQWYVKRFGPKAVAGRGGILPIPGL